MLVYYNGYDKTLVMVEISQHCFAESLSGEQGWLPCPMCRRRVHVPDEGFPVCRLSQNLKDQVDIALDKENDDKTQKSML